MILVKTKADSIGSSPLGLSTAKDEKPTLSFSQLLHGAKEGAKDEKGVQNGSFMLSLGTSDKEVKAINIKSKELKSSTKEETLSSLLKGEEKLSALVGENIELNPKVTQNLTPIEIKTLIADAKKFLKE
jgi:hypothetical protein